VRELENVIERATILSSGSELSIPAELLPAVAVLPGSAPAAAPPAALPGAAAAAPLADRTSLDQVERDHILAVLKRTGWRVDGPHGAARILALHPNTLRSRMKKLGIQRSIDDRDRS
jgi:transcriptional regulator with GAF, ATPase, and Fis domain